MNIKNSTHFYITSLLFLFLIPINVALASLSTDFQSGGLILLGESDDEDTFGYLHITIVPETDALVFTNFGLDPETLEFVETEGFDFDDELILTANGWQALTDDYVVTEYNGNSVSALSSVGESIQLTGTPINLENQSFTEFIATMAAANNDNEYLDALAAFSIFFNPDFTFDNNAIAYQMDVSAIDDTYYLWVPSACNNRIDNECYFTYMQKAGESNGEIIYLDDLFVASEWDGADQAQITAAYIAFGNGNDLLAEFVDSDTTSGVVNFYIRSQPNNIPTHEKIGQGQWQRVLNQGTDMVLLELSDELVMAAQEVVEIDSTQLLFSEFGGYVRNGGYDLAGQSDTPEVWINNEAMEQLSSALFGGGNLSEDLENGGIVVLDGSLDENEIGYELITTNSENANLLFQDFVYSSEFQDFVEIEDSHDDDELVLTVNGWTPTLNDYFVTGLQGNLISVANSANESVAINGTLLNLQAITFNEFVGLFVESDDDSGDAEGLLAWSLAVDPEFTFSGDAATYLITHTALSESYYLWINNDCINRIDADCWYTYVRNSGQQNGAISSLDELFSATAWDGVDASQLVAADIAYGDGGVLIGEFVSSDSTTGAVNFYLQNFQNGTITFVSQGQWSREFKQGVEMVILELSDNLVLAVEDSVYVYNPNLLFSAFGGYVRSGGFELPGQVETGELEIWMNQAALSQLKVALTIADLDSDGDGVPDTDDAFPNDPTESVDTDGDLIGNNADLDDDNDGLPDEFENTNGLNSLDAADAVLDADGDGLSNTEEYALGTDINNVDTDGDGIPDNVDENPLVADETLYSGQLHVLPDMTGDSVAELGILSVDVELTSIILVVLDGKTQELLNTLVWNDKYSDSTLSLHVLDDINGNGVSEVGLFGIQDSEANVGKPQMFVRDMSTGNRVSVLNWPANWSSVSALVLPDITGDGLPEVGIQGRFNVGERPQLVVRDGQSNAAVDTFSYPNLFIEPTFYLHSDNNSDGFDDIATFGRIAKNNKIQVKVASGVDSKDRFKAYNFPDKWGDISWHRLDDMDNDGEDDWGLFGTNKVDGRPQLIVKSGTDPRGAIAIYAWPSEMQAAQFYRIPDMNNDGVDDVAAAGQRSNNGRYQFQIADGSNRNNILANLNLNLNLQNVSYHVLPDLSGDGLVEIGFLGVNNVGEYELVIRHGDTMQGSFSTQNLGSDWSSVPNIVSLGDTDNDGIDNVFVYGQNANQQLNMQMF